ncbi:YciI family protein [Pseudomonas sp. SDO524_S393]
MIFAIHAHYKPDVAERRTALLASHRAYLATVAQRIAFAGPLLDAQGEPVGSLMVVDFDDEAHAKAWLAEEPFTQGGLFARLDLQIFQNRWPQKTGFPEV